MILMTRVWAHCLIIVFFWYQTLFQFKQFCSDYYFVDYSKLLSFTSQM